MAAVGDALRPMGASLSQSWMNSLNNSTQLKGQLDTLAWDVGPSLNSQWDFAVGALEAGLSRCVTIKYNGGQNIWDSHDDNDATQSANFQELFTELGLLHGELKLRAGEGGGSLAEETVVVVLSEMARTPTRNADLGRDHWSYTSLLIFGPGVTGGRGVGEYDEGFYGRKIEPSTGEVSESGIDMHQHQEEQPPLLMKHNCHNVNIALPLPA